jgi:ribosomal protein L7/L12
MNTVEILSLLVQVFVKATNAAFKAKVRNLIIDVLDEDIVTPEKLTLDEVSIGSMSGRVAAIKAYKTRTGCGLKQAKDTVEGYFREHGLEFCDPQQEAESLPAFTEHERQVFRTEGREALLNTYVRHTGIPYSVANQALDKALRDGAL